MREMVEESLSGTWAGMAQGDLAPEMMSSTKLSTVSRERGEDVPLVMAQVSLGLWRACACCHTAWCQGGTRLRHELGAKLDPLLFQKRSSLWY